MKILVTGGAGFIGSNFLRYMVNKYPNYEFVNYDKLTYAGNLDNLLDIDSMPNYSFVKGDVCNLDFLTEILRDVDVVIHFAAESHVDLSIGNSLAFTKSNTYGTHVLLEAARVCKVKKFIHFSTDEVYGDIINGKFSETDKLDPSNPYSASKAAAEMIVQAYSKTFKLPIIMTRGNNNYGPYQYPEKIIPRFATDLMMDRKIPLHNPNPFRTYLHVDDTSRAVDIILHKGVIGETYNIGTEDEFRNIEIAKKCLDYFGKDESYIEHVQDRPFNDLRYSVVLTKLQNLGWKQEISFEKGFIDTLKWYEENRAWWEKLILKN
ncbi:MAG: dTDP-glucose 4,6-dehydratase [Nanoarchaeales archaeon]|nr:dTDP-glucose 4,6-dehydratase [Nanoarchaeales archaeon]